MRPEHDMVDFLQLISQALGKFSGTVVTVTRSRRSNHQRQHPAGDGTVECFSIGAIFDNLNILGTSRPFLSEVFPRYRQLCIKLSEAIGVGLGENIGGPERLFGLIPCPDPEGCARGCLPPASRDSRGDAVPQIGDLSASNPYYAYLREKYQVEYGVITNNGTVIGPDGGILAAALAVCETFPKPVTLVELGMGSGSTAMLLNRVERLGEYHCTDVSSSITDFFTAVIKPRLEASGVAVEVQNASCLDCALPPQADLMVIGVFYEAQPDLIVARGQEIARCLGNSGVLVVQSGKPENRFITELLSGLPSHHTIWPWYNEAFSLRKIFGYVSEHVVEDETVLVATKDVGRFRRILANLVPFSLLYADLGGTLWRK